MLSALCFAAIVAPYNYTGKLIDLMPEGAAWGMPATGIPIQITITENGSKVGPGSFALKGPKWESEAPLKIDGLKFANGTLTGTVQFKNASGCALDAVRFDIVSAAEQYKGKDAQGKEVTITRTQPIAEESPILFGDMPKDVESSGYEVKATGLVWKPETSQITVTAKLSGLTFHKSLFYDHAGSFLGFDLKGRLILGSGQQPALYLADYENDKLDSIASTPSYKVVFGVNPLDGSICAKWMNAHGFSVYSPGGDEKSTVEQHDDQDGMTGWPQMARYDGKGNLYVCFGESVSQLVGGKPSFVLKKAGQYDFAEYLSFDVAKDGSIFVGSDSNVFRFDPGGKNPKKIVQGPDVNKLGRIHGVQALKLDPLGNVWIADNTDDFEARCCVFDSNGKFIWTFGRGGEKKPDDGWLDGQVSRSVNDFAIAADGRAFVACGDQGRSVLYFTEF